MKTIKELLSLVINGSQTIQCPNCTRVFSVMELRSLRVPDDFIICGCHSQMGELKPIELN